jgi:hypothetical protein
MKKLFEIRNLNPVKRKEEDFDEKHRLTLEAIKPYARAVPQSNLTPVNIDYISRKTSIVFLLMPEWAHNFPPYNVARLAAITKAAGFETHAFDLNAKAFKDHESWGLDYNPWAGNRDWKWRSPHYEQELKPHVEPFLQQYIDKIVEINPTVVGLTLYYCNEEASKWIAKELKRRIPNLIIMVGGPTCHQSYWQPPEEYDYIVSGEGEKMLIEALEEIESGSIKPRPVWFRQEDGQRLDLDSVPSPDYSYFPPSDYSVPNGVNAEISRGCTAKCVFCSETHYWKYRGRMARNIIDELADLYYNRGVDVVWFIDSLVNGNLKELRAFAKGVVARGMKLNWTGYARCDGRMDLDYYKDLVASGCFSLNYGIESGSNRVLADMDKGVTVDEIEQNLRDGASVGVEAFTNWIVGFPTERPQDLYDSMQLVWRNRNNKISSIAPGMGFIIPPDTIIAQAVGKFNVAKNYFENNWITNDYANSKVHRLVRLKIFNILLIHLINNDNHDFTSRPNIKQSYTLLLKNRTPREIEFEQFDFNICNTGQGNFADTVANEVWPLLRMLWRTRGAFKLNLVFDPQQDSNEFGWNLSSNFTANIEFEINELGQWHADFDYKFVQADNAWSFNDFSTATSVAASRARKLAVPGSTGQVVYDDVERDHHLELLEQRRTLDFSFEYKYSNNGQW